MEDCFDDKGLLMPFILYMPGDKGIPVMLGWLR